MADTTPGRPRARHAPAHDRHCGHAALPQQGSGHDRPTDAAGHVTHGGHMHVHGESCGHPAVPHDDHVDFVHGGHRHAGHGRHYDEH